MKSSRIEAELLNVKGQVEELKSRIAALSKLLQTIRDESCFTHDERVRVEAELSACERNIRDKEQYLTDATTKLQTTIHDCETKIESRERILNELFADCDMRAHTDLMQHFVAEHKTLQDVVNE